MALPLTDRDKFLLLAALGLPESANRVIALLDLAGTGNMTGPGVASDNAIVRFDGTTGALVQNSSVLVSDAGAISGIASLNSVSAATLAFLDATSSIQTQLNGKLSTGGGSVSGPILEGNGSAAAPSYSFSGDTDTGIFHPSANEIRFSTGGTDRAHFDSAGLTVSGLSLDTSVILNTAGSVGAPSYSFGGDANTGMYSDGADQIAFSTGGVGKFFVRPNVVESGAVHLFQPGTALLPGIAFSADPDTGIFNASANELQLITGGSSKASVNSAGLLALTPGTGADVAALSQFAGTATGTVRQFFRNSTSTRAFEIDADFTGAAESLVLQSDTALLGVITRASAWTIGGTGLTPTHRLNSSTATPNADTLTLTNGPTGTAGNPDIYLSININGVLYAIPAWSV